MPFTKDLCLILSICQTVLNQKRMLFVLIITRPSHHLGTHSHVKEPHFSNDTSDIWDMAAVFISLSVWAGGNISFTWFSPAPTSMDRVRMCIYKCAFCYLSGARSNILTSLLTGFCMWLYLSPFLYCIDGHDAVRVCLWDIFNLENLQILCQKWQYGITTRLM